MSFRSLIPVTVLAASITTAALAADDSVILASNPDSVMDFFFSEGIPAKLTEDAVGDPLIEFRHNGDKMQLFFYDCENNKNCLALQFFAGYVVDDGVSLDVINAWNADRRFVRAYKTEDGAARIEMDIATSFDGVTQGDFKDLYDLWIESVGLFEERIDW